MDPYLFVFIILSFLTAVVDFFTFKIPNEFMVFLLVLFVAKTLMVAGFSWAAFRTPGLMFLLTFLVGFSLYAAKLLGAGDVKFIAVVSLWMSEFQVLDFLIFMSLGGAVLALVYHQAHPVVESLRLKGLEKILPLPQVGPYFQGKLEGPVGAVVEKNKVIIPYGVAVFVGCIGALYSSLH